MMKTTTFQLHHKNYKLRIIKKFDTMFLYFLINPLKKDKKMTTAVTGYQQIQQFSQFFPKNHVKDVLSKKVGKNNVVSITDFLLGNDYTEVESPYLPTGLLEEIKSKKNLNEDIDAWINKAEVNSSKLGQLLEKIKSWS